MNSALYITAIVAVIILMVVAQFLAGKPQPYPYEKSGALFTAAERSFLDALEQSVGAQYRITGKVRLADIIHVRKGLPANQQASARNRINQKHVDFVLCDPRTLQIVGVIELDDRSHDRPDRQRRDEFVDGALAASGVPILHIKVQRTYNAGELRRQIDAALAVGRSI